MGTGQALRWGRGPAPRAGAVALSARSAEAPTSLSPLASMASGFAALSDNVKEVVPCVCPIQGPALARVPSMPVLSVAVPKPMCEASYGVLAPSHCHRVGAGTRLPSTSCHCPLLAIPFARSDPRSQMGAVGPVAPCPFPCRRGGEGWRYQPPACGGAAGADAVLPAGVPGVVPYLPALCMAVSLPPSLLDDNKALLSLIHI